MSKKYMRDMVPLVVICLVSALLLASFNLLTKDPIQQNSQRAAEETRTRMLPIASSFEPMEVTEGSNMDSVYQGLDASGEPVGYVIQTTVNGYGGEVVVTLGMDMDGVITGVDVGGENFSETPGLGALAKEPAFTQQYIGKKVPLTLVKGNEPKGENHHRRHFRRDPHFLPLSTAVSTWRASILRPQRRRIAQYRQRAGLRRAPWPSPLSWTPAVPSPPSPLATIISTKPKATARKPLRTASRLSSSV